MELHQTLPFSDYTFLYYAIVCCFIFALLKIFGAKIIPAKYILCFLSLAYILLLYPKPLHITALVVYLFIAVVALRKWYRKENLFLPMLLIALPMLLMKFFNVLPINDNSKLLIDIRNLVQIAGISYLIFKIIGLYVDMRNKKEKINLIDFLNFSLFVPSLLIGPIDRFARFTNDVSNAYKNINKENIFIGLDEIILGFLYKFIFSVLLYKLVILQLGSINNIVIYHLSYMYAYLFYLFFDFAGYSLLAIGFARFMGVQLPKNFDMPFLARNPKEFWKHWHITLGDWLNDYFFKPLFKFFTTKKILTGPQRQGLALFLTFLLMGFWNGFEAHFVLSGALFGLYSVVHNMYTIRCKKQNKDIFFGNLSPKFVTFISVFIQFNLVAFAIYLFSGNLI